MKYQVIARRYRPRGFDEVVGQESVASTLRNAILQGRLAHAYLFAGPRGVGKTSMARIFAKALNCPEAQPEKSRPKEKWGTPCDVCDTCKAIHSGDDIDVMEMDGASYRGIEEIRDIVENVKFTPSRSAHKIFIIDEVHMLTREAFNALLKTLEEPPSHVKFIFATTEAHKIPDTVLSRCQRFDFRPIGEEDIVKRLGQICEAEAVTADRDILLRIARCGKGGLRDAQTLLDQVITFSDKHLKDTDLERVTGRLPEEAVDSLVKAIMERDPPGAFRAVEDCFARGADPATLLDQTIEKLHDRLRSLVGGGAAAEAPKANPEPPVLDMALGRLQILNETAAKLRNAPYPRLSVELALVKLARLEDPHALNEALGYLRSIEDRLGTFPPRGTVHAQVPGEARRPSPSPQGGGLGPQKSMPQRPRLQDPMPPVISSGPEDGEPPPEEDPCRPPAAAIQRAPAAPPAPEASPAPEPAAAFDFFRLKSLWSQILIEGGQRFPKVAAFLGKAGLREAPKAGTFTAVVDSEFGLSQLRDPRRIRDLEALVREVTGAPWRMTLDLELAAKGAAPKTASAQEGWGAPGPANGGTARGRGGQELRENPVVKKAVDLFRGKLI